jgi:hypothetical protein
MFDRSDTLSDRQERDFGTEIPKHAGLTEKSGKNQFGPEKHWFPSDRLSGIKSELSKSLSCLSDNVSDLSNICRTYIFFTTSTELHIYWLNP